jgi:hypothetical protein
MLNYEPTEKVNMFKYLGCSINCNQLSDINIKLSDFHYTYGTIKITLGDGVRKNILLKFYEVMNVPTFLYRSECWALNNQHEKPNEVHELRFLRADALYGRTDHSRNQTMRRELNIFIFLGKIVEFQRSCKEWRKDFLKDFIRIYRKVREEEVDYTNDEKVNSGLNLRVEQSGKTNPSR